MPFLKDAYSSPEPTVSFELFPPKTEAGEAAMFRHVDRLMEYSPAYITCTYGAGGSTQDKTLGIVERVKKQCSVPVASHLTCVGSTVDQLRSYLSTARDRGIDAIVALRGDPPKGETSFQAVEGGLRYANELVALIEAEFSSFDVAVAGYPETHQEATSPAADIENLKRKVDSGADAVITQLFYQNDDYFEFVDRCRAIGIEQPIVPGILPVTNLAQIQRITTLCAAKLPESFVSKLSEKDDEHWQYEVGVEFATAQVRELLDRGAPGVHFYVLNKSKSTSAVLDALK